MVSLALLVAAVVGQPVAIKPVGPWTVHAEEDMCLLERSYPVGKDKVSLIFRQLLDLPTMQMFVLDDPRRIGEVLEGSFSAQVEPRNVRFAGRYVSATVPKSRLRLTQMTVERQLLDQLADGDTVEVRAASVHYAFVIGGPDKARAALQNCTELLKKSWGIDPVIAARAVTPLEGDPQNYFTAKTYPIEAFNNGVHGRVIVLLAIKPDGGVETCRIVASAGPLLNAGTCKVAMRIRFKAPLDKDGQALPSTYVMPVNWVLP